MTQRITFQPSGASPAFTVDVLSISTDAVQTLNIGSQSTGAGAGKVTFNPFSFTKKPDSHSADLFARLCTGAAFQKVSVDVLTPAGTPYVNFTMGQVAVKTMALSGSAADDSFQEVVTLEYGHVAYSFSPQNADGSLGKPIGSGWDRTRNMAEDPARVGSA